jgi:hypothetical protein
MAVLARLKELPANPEKRVLARAAWGSLVRPRGRTVDLEERLDATYGWLCAAQDATPDGGVAGSFDLIKGRWWASYPETTGYIIPTFLALADVRADDEARSRALRMADWSCDVQMEDGSVLSGLMGMKRRPAVFNTGQAMFGWISAYQATGTERYANSARLAGEWLVRGQDPDGAWRGELSAMTSAPVHTYNVRCAWALAAAASALGEQAFADAAVLACDWALAQQNDAGWFAHNAFSEDEVPLLHTISYVIEGLVGVYAFLGGARLLDAARRAVDALATLAGGDGLAGRLDAGWRATVSWRCPTGDAQIATMLHRLQRLCPGYGYDEAASRLIADVASMQIALSGGESPSSAPSGGGVPGSWPVWGEYMRFALPNWAAKFFLDALLLETADADEKGFPAALADA